jgi:hypothetical protein
MRHLRAPEPLDPSDDCLTVFLAGSIENGAAEDWQGVVVAALRHAPGTLLNPRRTDWAEIPPPNIESPQLVEQIGWELDAIEACDVVAFHFCAGTLSPIAMLELGLVAKDKDVVVSCAADFWRRPNVLSVCNRYGLQQVDGLDALVAAISDRCYGKLNGDPILSRKKASR